MKYTKQVIQNYEIDFPFEIGDEVFIVTLKNALCPECGASGRNENEMACSKCKGTGLILKEYKEEKVSGEELSDFMAEISNIAAEDQPSVVTKDGCDSEFVRTSQGYVQMLFQGKAVINDLEIIESFGRISFRIDFNIDGYRRLEIIHLKPLEHGFDPTNQLYHYGCDYFRLFKTEDEANEFLKTV